MKRFTLLILCCVSASLFGLREGQAGVIGGGFTGFFSYVEGAVGVEIEKGAAFEGYYTVRTGHDGHSSSSIWLSLLGKERVFRFGQTVGDAKSYSLSAPGVHELLCGPFALGPVGKYFVEQGFLILPDVFKASPHRLSPIELDFKGFAHGEIVLFFKGKKGSAHGIIETLTVSGLSEEPFFQEPGFRFQRVQGNLGKDQEA